MESVHTHYKLINNKMKTETKTCDIKDRNHSPKVETMNRDIYTKQRQQYIRNLQASQIEVDKYGTFYKVGLAITLLLVVLLSR